jgi:hypothetical protein
MKMTLLGTAGMLALFMAALYTAGKLFIGGRRRGFLLYAVFGVASLFTLHALHAGVGLNAVTMGVSALLGVPGTALIWLMSVIG